MYQILLVLALVPLYALYRAYGIWNNLRRSRLNGCLPPKRLNQNKTYTGFDVMADSHTATEQHNLPAYVLWRYENNEVWTGKFWMFGRPIITTVEPENVKAILATQFKDFGLAPLRHKQFHSLLGDGIFTLDGKGWEVSRQMLRPQFAREQINDLEMLENHVQKLMRLVPEDGSEVDLSELFFKLTMDSATEFLFGESANTLDPAPIQGEDDSTVNRRFGPAFTQAQEFIQRRLRLGPLWWTKQSKEYNSDVKTVDKFIDKCVARALDKSDEEKAGGKYVFAEALAKVTRDKKTIRDQLLNILLAGRDTTASMLGFVFFHLARDKRVFEKLRAEVIEKFGYGTEEINFVSLKECTYLKYVLNEALRLYPIVSGNARAALRDTTLPLGGGPDQKSPVFVEKGQMVVYNPFSMHRRKDIYGEDANEFIPERWDQKQMGRGWEYLPFNGGPRICLGQQFALTEGSYVVARLLQQLKSIDPAASEAHLSIPRYYNTLTLSVYGGVNCTTERDPEFSR